jgi:hypothetical protein
MDTANPQGGGRRVRTVPAERLRQEEDALLIAMEYKPVDGGERLLWVKADGIYYGREAALQVEKRKQREEDA